jgi:hypothetical protein
MVPYASPKAELEKSNALNKRNEWGTTLELELELELQSELVSGTRASLRAALAAGRGTPGTAHGALCEFVAGTGLSGLPQTGVRKCPSSRRLGAQRRSHGVTESGRATRRAERTRHRHKIAQQADQRRHRMQEGSNPGPGSC